MRQLSTARSCEGLLRSAIIVLCMGLQPLHAAEPVSRTYQIAPQPVATALKAFAAQSDLQLIFTEADVGDAKTSGVNGSLPPREALSQILKGTDLEFKFTTNNVVVVRRIGSERASLRESDPSRGDGGQAVEASAADAGKVRIEEIIVSAVKRQTRLQETAVSISVLGREELDRRSLVSATDYLSSVPGVHIDSFGLGANLLVIRGLGLAPDQSPTAGAYLGDVPLSDALDSSITDVKLVDMDRVEVLRGPQGTLYGAGAMGGAIRQIPAAPILDRVESGLKLGYAATAESDDPSYSATGVFNLPLVDRALALRVAAYHFKKAGYVDLVSTPAMESLSALTSVPVAIADDTGGHEYTGARAAMLFAPADELEMTLTLGHQSIEEDGRSEVAMSSNDYVFSALSTGREYRKQDFDFANLALDYDLGWATLTSSSSWTRTDSDQNFSHSRVIPSASTVPNESTKKALFQELRIATELDGPVQLVGGGYYEDIERDGKSAVRWTSPDLVALQAFWGTTDPEIFRTTEHSDLSQLAFFGELSYEIADRWTLTAGARWFEYERNDASTSLLSVAPGVDPITVDTGNLPTEEDGQVYKVAVDYQPNDSALLYATWSQGFRLGQTIDQSAAFALFQDVCDRNDDGLIDGTTFPWSSKSTLLSDRLNNLEIGGKLTLLDGRLNLNAAAYRIKWHDLPVSVAVAVEGLGCGATFNGGEARSQGFELEAMLRATENLDVTLSGSLTDTEYLDDLTGQQGNRLPFSPKYNARIGLQYNFAIWGRSAFVRSDLSYVGESATAHNPPDVVFTDAYRNLGARAGIAFERFGLELYGTNLTNENPLIGVFNLNRGWRMEPRAVGLEINVDF